MSTTINWNKFSYTEKQLREAVTNNRSARAAMLSLGLSATGAGYKPFMRLIKILSIDTTHWLGQAYLKGQKHKWNKTKALKEILVLGVEYQSYKLKRRLLTGGLLLNECQVCKITTWLGQSLNLHLDHINGNPTDNRLENLRLLCPNCHSQTATYCGRNKRK